jgi:hypothetical protein
MAKYFTIMRGHRGCYMPDSCHVVMARTRRELKAAIADEVRFATAADEVDGPIYRHRKSDVATCAAAAWYEAQKPNPTHLSFVVPYGERNERPFAVQVSVASRQEYLEQKESD